MKKIEVTAKNVQKAIEQGLKELNATQDQVDIKIIDEGGLFRKAKIELVLDVDVEKEREKEEKKSETKVAENKENKEESAKETKKKQIKKEEPVKEEKSEPKEEKPCHCELDVEKVCELGKEFLTGLIEKMGVEAKVECMDTEVGITFNAGGEKVSLLIGKRGETLNAIQEILSNYIKNIGYRQKKVFFDVENYKNRREMSLITLAERMAKKAIKINKPIKLEKMSAYERKIIHTSLQNLEGVTTKSEGEEPNRHLIIVPVKKDN
ncbi:MAG: KH domain-containing protein [Clostridia bacterium]|nr:KH domain-containing protein [Clostridia bacterium]